MEDFCRKLSGTKYKLISKASIEDGRHLYSQEVPENRPISTTFKYNDENGAFKIVDHTLEEEEGHVINNPVFDF